MTRGRSLVNLYDLYSIVRVRRYNTVVQQRVTVNGNNGTRVLCEICGDLLITGNDAVVAECTVFGKILVKGNNAKLVANRVAQGIVIEGKETLCDGHVAFSDANGDKVGAPIGCGATGTK